MNTEPETEATTERLENEQPETATAIAKREKPKLIVGERGYIVPTTVEEAARMAQAVIMGGFAPDSYKDKISGLFDPNKIMLGIMAAMEAGLQPLYGLRQIAIINGRPTIWGDAAMALVQSKNLIDEYIEERIGTAPTNADLSKWPAGYGWKVTIRRKGQKGEYVGEFTVAMAKRANLWLNPKKAPWREHPDRMLKIRARAFPLRDGFADALAGLAIREEVEDHEQPVERHVEINLSDAPTVEAPPMEDQDSLPTAEDVRGILRNEGEEA